MSTTIHKKSLVLILFSFLAVCNFAYAEKPGDYFDLKHWKLTLPVDQDNDQKVDEVSTKELKRYSHPAFFYLNDDQHLVFTSPNKGSSTPGSPNTRSELRQMLKGNKPKSRRNNFALKANKKASKFGSVGGTLEATLKVNHVARKAYYSDVYPAFSVVVGQVHAGKDRKLILAKEGFGWGNEPIKIFYKKWPNHARGSVFWNYERNLPLSHPDRSDISYPVWGNTWEDPEDPGAEGIALNEEFSYSMNIYENTMYLTFSAQGHPTINYEINLADNIDANGNVDTKDNPHSYAQDWFYFKAGAYNQCNTSYDGGFWKPGCRGTGDWAKDKKRGSYAQVTFSKLEQGKSSSAGAL